MKVRPRLSRKQSQEATRLKLIEAAEQVFIRSGVDAASIESIAETAGYSRGAFYSNFPDKDAIFLAVMSRRQQAASAELDAIMRSKPEAGERLEAIRGWYTRQCQAKEWITIEMEFQLRALRNRVVRGRLGEMWRQEVETYAGLVGQYFAEAGLETPPVEPVAIALTLLAAAQGLGQLSLFEGGTLGRQQLDAARELVFNRVAGGWATRAAGNKEKETQNHEV